MKTIVMVLDCVRYDHLGCNGNHDIYTPTIDQIAKEGALFHNHHTVSPWTNPSVASFVTGIYPHKLNTFSYKTVFPPDTKTLFDYYNEQAGGNACFLKNFHFFGGHEGIDIVDYVWHTHAILDWMEKNDGRDYFLYLHYWNTHLPYFTKFSAEGYFDSLHKIVALLQSGKPEEIAKVRRIYRHSIERASEEFVYAVMEKLDKLGSLQDANVVITADHGESFGKREAHMKDLDVFGMHGKYLYEEVMHIPLIIKSPGLQPGSVVQDLTRSIDVMPSLLELNGWAPDPAGRPMDGRSLLRLAAGQTEPARDMYMMTTYLDRFDDDVISESFEKYGYRQGDWKLIYNRDRAAMELYNVARDPGEVDDLAGTDVAKREEMLAALSREINMEQARSDEEQQEIAKRMKDLGYM